MILTVPTMYIMENFQVHCTMSVYPNISPGRMAVFAYTSTYVSQTTCHTVVCYSFLDSLIMLSCKSGNKILNFMSPVKEIK
jgi:hypothetical protein